MFPHLLFFSDIKGTSTFLGCIQKCIYTNSYQTATVFQEQTLEAKMFSPKLNQYYEEISSKGWFKVIHPSGYVPQSYNYVSFKVRHWCVSVLLYCFFTEVQH